MRHLLFYLLLFACGQAWTQTAQPDVLPLFQEDQILEASLYTNMRSLLKDRGEERDYHRGRFFVYQGEEGDSLGFEVKIKVRGNFRRNRSNCEFPPLRVKFDKKESRGTLFAKNGKLKLVTHCQSHPVYEQNLIQEYLCYRLYNLVDPFSFKVRMFRLRYVDSLAKEDPLTRYAFFIEDDDDMAERNGGMIIKADGAHPLDLDPVTEIRLALFCYMIGNTDWSIPERHNIRLVATIPGAPPRPVPYDFDWSGLVNANYAKPNPMLGISTVRQRLYRGFCQEKALMEQVRGEFLAKKEAMMALVTECAWLDEQTKEESKKYLTGFFETLENDRAFKREILRGCRINN